MAFKDLPSWAKGSIAVLGAVTIAVSGFVIYKKINNFVSTKPARDTQKASTGDLKDLNKNQSTAQTISDSQAQAYASSLFTAMDGYQTDEDAIYSIFGNLKNDADVLAVVTAYGIREVSSGAWNPEPNYKGDLTGALRSELDSSEMNKVNTILANKNIKFRF